ncbi:hypothetical protein [Streptomyces sp. uw30]|nr:hypothetical protein [Streptomyces sp. uw30]
MRQDCPPSVGAGFGSHAEFAHRVRAAGIIDGPARYATRRFSVTYA